MASTGSAEPRARSRGAIPSRPTSGDILQGNLDSAAAPKPLPTRITGITGRKKEAKPTKDDELTAHLDSMDSMIMGFYGE